MELGREAFRNWQQKYKPQNKDNSEDEHLWFSFEEKGFPFFMVDSRTERKHRCATNLENAELIHEDQFKALEKWLCSKKHDDKPKFIVSPAMPFPRTQVVAQTQNLSAAVQSDGWDGYPHSLQRIVKYIAKNKIQNIIFLSGDAHLSLVSEIVISHDKTDINLLSIHSSGMYSPYPFANARKEDFALNEDFLLSDKSEKSIHICVKTGEEDIDPGNGFSIIEVYKEKEKWVINVAFNRADGTRTISKTLPRI